MMKKILKIIVEAISTTILYIFAHPQFRNKYFPSRFTIKYWFLQKILRINSHVNWPVHPTSQIKSPEKIEKGDRFPGIAIGCYLDGRNGIEIGRNTWIGPRASLISMNHESYNYNAYIEEDPIIIGDNCWLGANVIILPGVKLGNHVIVGAGAVVTRSFEKDDIVVAGNPARVVKQLEPYPNSIKDTKDE